jgi:hypothetical protein
VRIVTWNVFKGEPRQRAAQLSDFAPDVVVLQDDDQCLWFGNRPTKGVGIVANGDWRLAVGPLDPEVPDSAYPVVVTGPTGFHMLSVWTQRRPTYIGSLFDAVERYRGFLLAAPSIIIGDFNSHARWDRDDPIINHSRLVEMLAREFGLVSAYHSAPGRDADAPEEPTLYWQWKQHQQYHIDYCFVPQEWAPAIKLVQVGGYGEWEGQSDHRPLAVEIGDLASP